VNVYSNEPETAYRLIREAKTLLKANRWIITEIGYDLPSDEITHVGRGLNVTYLQQL
jgi:hypothetical protein